MSKRGTQEAIVATALKHFAERGFDTVTLAEIADEVGTTRPGILYHFNSKQALYEAVVRDGFLQLGSVLVHSLAEGTFDERLERMVGAIWNLLKQRPEIARLVIREMIGPPGPGQTLLKTFGTQWLDRVETTLRKEGGDYLRNDVPIRGALARLTMSVFLYFGAPEMRESVWGTDVEADSKQIIRLLFLRDPGRTHAATV